MRLSGKVIGFTGEPLYGAKIVVTDSKGVIQRPTVGATSEPDGGYVINPKSSDYLTIKTVGHLDKRIKVSEVCKQNSCNFDIKVSGKEQEVTPMYVFGSKSKVEDKFNWKKIALIAGISLLGVAAIIYGVKKLKK